MNNLNALEVLFIHFIHKRKENEVMNTSRWLHRYSTNPKKLIDSLITKNAITKTKDLNLLLQGLKVTDLKDILRNNNLKLSGNKPHLIERIIENENTINIDMDQYPSIYIATGEYLNLLDSTDFINFFDRGGIIDIFEAYDYYLKYPEKTSDEIIIDLLNKKLESSSEAYEKIQIYRILSEKYYDLNDEYSAQFHLHNSEMLQILTEIARFRENMSYGIYISMEDNPYLFLVNNGTILQYKTLLKTRQLTWSDLKKELIESTRHLKYSSKDKELAAQYLVEVINDDFEASKRLINSLSKGKSNTANKRREHANTKNYTDTNHSSPRELSNKEQSNLQKNSGCGCLLFLALPTLPVITYIAQIIIS